MNTIMNVLFLVLAAAMMFTVIVRLLFHVSYREPEGRALNRFLDTCRSTRPLNAYGFLGWIEELLYGVKLDRHELRRAVEHFRRRTEWCHAEQKIFGSQATAIGMLFTLVSLTTAATGTLDPTVVIAVGVMSSVYGLIIAIPGTMLHDIFQRRVDRFLDQADAVLEALDTSVDVPMVALVPATAPTPVLYTSRNASPSQGYQRYGGEAHRDPRAVIPVSHAATPLHQTGGTSSRSSAPVSDPMVDQSGQIAPSAGGYAAFDDNFDEQVVDWICVVKREGLDHD